MDGSVYNTHWPQPLPQHVQEIKREQEEERKKFKPREQAAPPPQIQAHPPPIQLQVCIVVYRLGILPGILCFIGACPLPIFFIL